MTGKFARQHTPSGTHAPALNAAQRSRFTQLATSLSMQDIADNLRLLLDTEQKEAMNHLLPAIATYLDEALRTELFTEPPPADQRALDLRVQAVRQTVDERLEASLEATPQSRYLREFIGSRVDFICLQVYAEIIRADQPGMGLH
jgi:hypothetical protein